MHVIVSAYGSSDFAAYEATVENAKEILSWQVVPEEVTKFAADQISSYATYETIATVVNQILNSAEGTVVFTSKRDNTQTITATQEAKQEIVMFCFNHKIAPSSVSAYSLKAADAYKELQCLSYFHDTHVVEEWIADWAQKYSTITNDRWKVGVTDIRKVRYVLNFVNELSNRDQIYDVVEVKPTC